MAQTTATVYSCEPFEGREEGRDISAFRVVFSYSVDGDYFSGEFQSLDEMAKDQTFTLSYDCNHPELNEYTLAEDEDMSLIFKIAIGVIVAGVVGYGVVYFFIK